MTDLFAAADESRRARLRAAGWYPILRYGVSPWRRPDGVILTENEAFKQLESLPAGTSPGGETQTKGDSV